MTKTCLISVSDKTGVTDLALRLHELGYRIVSTGGTAHILRETGIPVQDVSEITAFPEILEGRVKSLHPKIHAGILARRDVESDTETLRQQEIDPIDLVIVSLYPFGDTIAKPDVTFDMAIEMIDVGGPTLIRAAAKNFKNVTVVCHPEDYEPLLTELETQGETAISTRYRLAMRAYEHTAAYDVLIARYLQEQADTFIDARSFPDHLNETHHYVKPLPEEYAASPMALYRTAGPEMMSAVDLEVLQGYEPDAEAILAADLAIQNLEPFIKPALCAVKGAHMIGLACGATLSEAWETLYARHSADLTGSLIASNTEIDDALAEDFKGIGMSALLTSAYIGDSFQTLSEREDLTLYSLLLLSPKPSDAPNIAAASPVRFGDPQNKNPQGIKAEALFRTYPIRGGMIVAPAEHVLFQLQSFEITTERQLSQGDFGLIEAAMSILRTLPAMSGLIWKDQGTVRVSAYQNSMDNLVHSLVEAPNETVHEGIAVFSNPIVNTDHIEQLANAGIRLIVEPGTGTPIDEDCIEAANSANITLVFTGSRLDEASGGMIR